MIEDNFAARIKEARQIHGMSQTELAAAVGLTKVKILRIENGKRHIRLNEAFAITETFALTIDRMCSSVPLKSRIEIR